MAELLHKRTYTQKHFDNGDGTFTMEAHIGHIHYKDENGDLVDSDILFEDMGSYWRMVKHNYHLYVNKDFSANQLIRFDNKYEGANHSIYYEPKMLAWVNATDLSDMQVFRNQQAVTGELIGTNVIRWTDAFGDGLHFEVSLRRSGFKKEVIIQAKNKLELPPTADHKLVALFKYTGDGLTVKKKDGTAWDADSYFDDEVGFDITETGGKFSLIRPAYISDSSEEGLGKQQLIRVFWKKYNNALWQAKVLPKVFLNNAVYPVRADTDTSYYAGAGDGTVYAQATAGNWDTWHNATSGTAENGDTARFDGPFTGGSGEYYGWRGFFPFDTSALPDDVTVTAATLYLYVVSKANDGLDDAYQYHGIVQTSQASNTTLANDDFDTCGDVHSPVVSVTKAFADITASAYNTWALDATGLTWVSKTSYTKLGIRSGRDLADASYTGANKYNTLNWRLSEYTGTGSDPYLAVTYSAGGGTNTQLNIGDTWKAVTAMQVNIGDTWKPVTKAQVNIGDTWKTIF